MGWFQTIARGRLNRVRRFAKDHRKHSHPVTLNSKVSRKDENYNRKTKA